MFLNVKYNHDKTPEGWRLALIKGAGGPTPEESRRRQDLLKNGRPPFCQATASWRDAQGIFWTIEKWFIRKLVGGLDFSIIHVLKRDGLAISVEGTITLPNEREGATVMEENYLIPSWFESDFLKGETIICRRSTGGPNLHTMDSLRRIGPNDDHLHPVVKLK
jgi:hypothetical protein